MVELTKTEAGICLLGIIKAGIAADWGCLPKPARSAGASRPFRVQTTS